MNFSDYEKKFFFIYEEFAATVKLILERAIAATNIPRPQSIQSRAKEPSSLKARLEQGDLLESETLETNRRDLAGARLIFYTNTDVDKFVNSRLIFENFEVDLGAIKIHHPTDENQQTRYRAVHYTIGLKEDRAKLPEYSQFRGLRCEIQIQTILNHAWSETSHDILYKDHPRKGFGSKATEAITKRFNRIMDKYLLPAGHEFQRVQHDYERLRQGKELFDQNILASLSTTADNNERHEILSSLKDQVLPNYDDIPAIYQDLVEPLTAAVAAARKTSTKSIKTPFGEIEGKSASDVTRLAIQVFELLRYIDIGETFEVLCTIFSEETDADIRRQILDTVERLAKYDLDVWRQAGPTIQSTLVHLVAGMDAAKRDAVRPIILSVLRSALSSEISGTTWKADSVILSSGAVPFSPQILSIREKAIEELFNLFSASKSDEERRQILYALREATRSSQRGAPTNDALLQTLTDSAKITEFLTANAENISFELREAIEHDFLYDYHRARELAETNRFECKTVSTKLIDAIIEFRDRINSDINYVRYKTLVGFETVLPDHWQDENRDYTAIQQHRAEQAKLYIEEINSASENGWFEFIERCASTKSNDGATFPTFVKFLILLAEQKPQAAQRLLDRAHPNLLRFFAAFLNGFYQSDKALWRDYIHRSLAAGTNLNAIVQHWQFSKPTWLGLITLVLEKAISCENEYAVAECLVMAIEDAGVGSIPCKTHFFRPALEHLTDKKTARWARNAWFGGKESTFFELLSTEDTKLLLENLVFARKIDFQIENMLVQLARKHLTLVWDFFEQRLQRTALSDEDERYESVPYKFHHGLDGELAKNVDVAVSKVRDWYAKDTSLFRFRGGRLLNITFPGFQRDISENLKSLVDEGTELDADFVLGVMENYHGEPSTHDVLKSIVTKYPNDLSKLSGVRVSLNNTGGVWGEFGLVEAMRSKKAALGPWLKDAQDSVRSFAKKYSSEIDVRIAQEQRRAEQDKALRELEYERDGDEEDGPKDESQQ